MKKNAAEQINELILKYQFPLEVLQDVYNRVSGNEDNEHYLLQQVRYLNNLIQAGHATLKNDKEETPNE